MQLLRVTENVMETIIPPALEEKQMGAREERRFITEFHYLLLLYEWRSRDTMMVPKGDDVDSI